MPKSRAKIKGIAFLSIASILLAILAYSYYCAKTGKEQLDSKTFCPIKGPNSITVLLFDRTDPLNATQIQALKNHVRDIKNEIEKHGMLQIYTIEPITDHLLTPLITICNPGRGKDLNPMIANPKLVERKWQEFSRQIQELIEDMIEKPFGEPTSPIMESVKSIAVSSFGGKETQKIPKKLIVISDMMENSEVLNQYHGLKPFSSLSKTPAFLKARANLAGVDVYIIYVRRDSVFSIQGRAHIEFWQDYISAMGGRLIQVTSLY